MGFYLEYFCDNPDCESAGNYEGPQGSTRKEVLKGLRAAGWKRITKRGWFCPSCAQSPVSQGKLEVEG